MCFNKYWIKNHFCISKKSFGCFAQSSHIVEGYVKQHKYLEVKKVFIFCNTVTSCLYQMNVITVYIVEKSHEMKRFQLLVRILKITSSFTN